MTTICLLIEGNTGILATDTLDTLVDLKRSTVVQNQHARKIEEVTPGLYLASGGRSDQFGPVLQQANWQGAKSPTEVAVRLSSAGQNMGAGMFYVLGTEDGEVVGWHIEAGGKRTKVVGNSGVRLRWTAPEDLAESDRQEIQSIVQARFRTGASIAEVARAIIELCGGRSRLSNSTMDSRIVKT